MSEDLESMAKRLNEVRDSIKRVTKRPQVTIRDTLSLWRENIASRMYQKSYARINNQEASQESAQVLTQQQGGPLRSHAQQGLPFLKSLRGRFGGQRSQQLSEEEIHQARYQEQREIEQDFEQQRAIEKQRRLNKILKRKSFSVDGV